MRPPSFFCRSCSQKNYGNEDRLRYRLLHEIRPTGLEMSGTNMPDFPPIGVAVSADEVM